MSVDFFQIPYKRDQDVIRISDTAISVVDGWNNEQFITGNTAGRRVAELVAKRFPEVYAQNKDPQLASEKIDREVIQLYPNYATCVGVFLFIGKKNTIVSFGTVNTFVWNGREWYKPQEIEDDSLSPTKYPTDTKDLFGGQEWKKSDPIYALKADWLSLPPTTPVLLCTDGLDDVMKPEEIPGPSKNLLSFLKKEISRRGTQKDDISIVYVSS